MNKSRYISVARVGLVGVCVILIAGSSIMTYVGLKSILEVRRFSANWEQIEGVLAKAEISKSSSSGKMYLWATYHYQVNGNTFFGTKPHPVDSGTRERTIARSELEEFGVVDRIPIYYDRSDPQISTLHLGVDYSTYGIFFISLAVLGVAVYGLIRVTRRRVASPSG